MTSLFTSVTARAAMEPHVEVSVSPPVAYSSDTKPQLQPDRQLILELEKLPVLWDKSHPDYTNKLARHAALRKLLVILKRVNPNATTEHVRMKINSIRSNYRRELRKVLASKSSGAAPDEVYTPKSWAYKHLGFLYNSEGTSEQTRDSCDAEEEHSEYKTEMIYDSDTASHSSGVYYEYTTTPSSSKKVKREAVVKLNDPLDSVCSPEPSTSVNVDHAPITASSNNYIAFEWAETLGRLEPLQRLYAKKAINDILFEAELGNLNRVKEPSSPSN